MTYLHLQYKSRSGYSRALKRLGTRVVYHYAITGLCWVICAREA